METLAVFAEFEKLGKEFDMLCEMINQLPNMSGDDRDLEAEALARGVETQMQLITGTAIRVGALLDHAVPDEAEEEIEIK